MKQILGTFIFILLAVAVVSHISEASSFSTSQYKPFGGTVYKTTAQNVKDIEDENYKCAVPGRSITVKPIGTGQNQNLLISAGTQSSTGNKEEQNQYFLGFYEQSRQTISCIYQGYPPSTTTTTLNRLKLFGTSKGKKSSY
jgi:hypothetical protein